MCPYTERHKGTSINIRRDVLKSLTKLEKNEIKKVKVLDLGDHRICMSAAILGLLTGYEVKINNFETVGTSSPSFLKIIKQLGGSFAKKNI